MMHYVFKLYIIFFPNSKFHQHEEEMRQLCRPKKLEIDTYWTKLREVYDGYLEKHNPIMAHYNALREKDEFYQNDIAKNDMQIQHASVKKTFYIKIKFKYVYIFFEASRGAWAQSVIVNRLVVGSIPTRENEIFI